MSKRPHQGRYLFQRPDSTNWWIKLQYPSNIKRSLGTSDANKAAILAAPLIADHKAKLFAARTKIETGWIHDYTPGRTHAASDGTSIIATDRELIHLDADGKVIRQSPNGRTRFVLVGLERRLGIPTSGNMIQIDEVPATRRPVLAVKADDDAFLETYLKASNITGHFAHEARTVWALYKSLTDNKPLKDADRDDGLKLVEHFEAQGLKSATIQKKIAWLRAAVNLEMKKKHRKLTFNPFSGVAPDRDDKQKRLTLDEADIKAIRSNLKQLGEADQLLLRVLAATGMRLSEAFEIASEATERGQRYAIVGHKTKASLRRVPFPATVLPHLPKTIKGPLFTGSVPSASKRLNRFLRATGIDDPGKVVHSLRHRAQDRLRAAECPTDIRWALLGHEDETVAAGYGEGFSVPQLKRWIDKIGGV